MKIKVFSYILALVICFVFLQSKAADLVPIHGTNIKECQILLSMMKDGKKSDSLAKKISNSNTAIELRESLRSSIREEGAATVANSDVYVTGVAIRDQKKIEKELKEVLNEQEFSKLNLSLKIISVPKNLHAKLVEMSLKDVWERLVYFLPSIARDYQRPTLGEAGSGLFLTALIETPTVISLFKSLPTLDATVTALTHTVLLTTFTIYQRAIANWMMRSSGQVEPFLKNLNIGTLFVLNYYIFGNLTSVLNYTSAHSAPEISTAFFAALTSFAVSQGITNVIQTEFYSKAYQGVRGKWVEMQKTQKLNDLAREAGNWVMFLPQMGSAYALSKAAMGHDVFLTMGAIQFNYWQLVLTGFWAMSYGVYKKPEVLNVVLPKYEKLHNGLMRLKNQIKTEVKMNFKQLTNKD